MTEVCGRFLSLWLILLVAVRVLGKSVHLEAER